jgi:hypothetical protein
MLKINERQALTGFRFMSMQIILLNFQAQRKRTSFLSKKKTQLGTP